MKNIVETARDAGSFKTLLAAAESAGLAETLSGTGPFTVFAPSDEAFAKLPEGAVESLMKDKEKLSAILKYHIVSGKMSAEAVKKQPALKTIQGNDLKVDLSQGVRIGTANVVKADIDASNGVIHVIDSVLTV